MADFPYDVVRSHSAKNEAAMRVAPERFRGDGGRVSLKIFRREWELRPSDSIPDESRPRSAPASGPRATIG